MTTTRQLTREQLGEWGFLYDLATAADAADHPGAAIELHREQIDTRRWVSVHQLVFRAPDDGQTYAVTYERGLTEQQEGHDPWAHADTITATLMEPRTVTITEWHPAPDITPGQVYQPAEGSTRDPADRITVREVWTPTNRDERSVAYDIQSRDYRDRPTVTGSAVRESVFRQMYRRAAQ